MANVNEPDKGTTQEVWCATGQKDSHPCKAMHSNLQVVNVPSKQLEGSHLSALSKCLNFAPAPARTPTTRIIANVEATIGQVKANENVTAKARIYIIGAIHWAKMPPKNITPKEMGAHTSTG